MSYLLPNHNNIIEINPTINNTEKLINVTPYISHSLYNYYNELYQQLIKYDFFENMIHNLNPYEPIFSKILGSKITISKLKPYTYLFYDLLEIINTFNLFENYKNTIIILHNTSNYIETIDAIKFIRNTNIEDTHLFIEENKENQYKNINNGFIG